MTWKRITSAPHDGTPFLACEIREGIPAPMAVCYLSEDATLCFDATGGFVDDEFQPTHWMPLPDPPA